MENKCNISLHHSVDFSSCFNPKLSKLYEYDLIFIYPKMIQAKGINEMVQTVVLYV